MCWWHWLRVPRFTVHFLAESCRQLFFHMMKGSWKCPLGVQWGGQKSSSLGCSDISLYLSCLVLSSVGRMFLSYVLIFFRLALWKLVISPMTILSAIFLQPVESLPIPSSRCSATCIAEARDWHLWFCLFPAKVTWFDREIIVILAVGPVVCTCNSKHSGGSLRKIVSLRSREL